MPPGGTKKSQKPKGKGSPYTNSIIPKSAQGVTKPWTSGMSGVSQANLMIQIGKAFGRPVLSVKYLGRDKTGKPLYQIRYKGIKTNTNSRPTRNYKTITFQGGVIGSPLTQGSGVPGGAGPKPTDQANLEREKERALQWLVRNYRPGNPDNQISTGDYNSLRSQIQNWKGTPERLKLWVEKVLTPNLPFGHTNDENAQQEDMPGYWDGFDFGGGGGGGYSEPEYKAPDRRVVEDMAKGMMTSLVGGTLDDRLDAAVNLYMKDHRRNWDSTDAEIDPAQSLLAYIRQQPEYQQIHELRPEQEDERTWISQRKAALAQGGLTVGLQDDFAVTQASAAGDLPDVAEAGAVMQTVTSGSSQGTLLEGKIKQTATNMFRGLAV